MTRFDPFAVPGPRWFSIAAHRPFLGDLAAGVLAWLGEDRPETLSDAVVLLPNRRAARAFTEALGVASDGRPVLLPQVRPLGDLEEDEAPFAPGEIEAGLPPAIGALARRFELAGLVRTHFHRPLGALASLEMAEALGRFLDSCQIEEVKDPARVGALIEADLAEHWRESAALLAIALETWPERLRELGLIDPAARRVTLLRRLADSWTERPPAHPVIAAGSTGTVPAAAAVLDAAARAPLGCVVLPGLDLDLADTAWARVEDQHPQGAMKALIEDFGVSRDQVRPWPAPEEPPATARGRARRRLLAEALKPPEATADWRHAIDEMTRDAADPLAAGLQGLGLVTGRTEEESAGLIAALLREALETPGRTAALITPDQALARRVQARLARWDLQADSSTGEPLSRTATGALIGALTQLMADGLSGVALLAVLKHPAVRVEETDAALSDLERYGLRGPRPGDWDALKARFEAARAPRDDGREPPPHRLEALDRAAALAADVEPKLAPLFDGAPADAADWTRRLVEAAEAVCGGPGRAWRGADGEAVARLLAQLIAEGAASGPLDAPTYAEMLGRMLAAEVVRTGGDVHPRLRILGAIEARLARADTVVLAGLEEGVWPAGAGLDPFLSRPMRAAIDLPSPERRIGLSAHDFAQAAAAPEVVLVHTERRGGQPSVKSRWLWRLEILVGGADRTLPGRPEIEAWARTLDAAPAASPPSLRPAPRPQPRPPVAARPMAMSVTRVEEWVRDPYATYVRYVLNLRQMSRPDERVDARIRGTAIHHAIEVFARQWESEGARDGVRRFADLYMDALTREGMPRAALARERPLAEGAGRFMVAFETERRETGRRVFVEERAELPIPTLAGTFTLEAKADRLELHDARLTVIDFKTGAAPTKKQVRLGFAAQLPLTAAMSARGAFGGLGAPAPEALIYVAVSGRDSAKDPVSDVSGDDGAEALAERAYQGLIARVERFADDRTAYGSRTAPQFAQKSVSDYDHLARVREWSIAAEGGEE
ncbi:double-strand break repair protein AddB [Brevundimonas lutea]|uniref:double-strand break repair protein AddB n=1 Tax=Brevundimonas lutea TaxID=2293980 RepID=UPI000F0124AB|nr:double-strand break repair protein AddB [Brevundimonas lutea]